MPNLRPVPLSENMHSSWQNLIQRTVQSQNIKAGENIKISSAMGDFTKVSFPTEVDMEHLIWKGDFDEFAEYNINDVVRVVPGVEYLDPYTAEPLDIGATSEEGFTYAPLSLGLFVCVNHVPPSWSDEAYLNANIVPTFGNNIPYNWQEGIRWIDYNVYYPIYPEIPDSNQIEVDPGYGFKIVANNTFWQAMPFGAIPLNVCIDGVAKKFYVVGSGETQAFNTDYLPYAAP